VFLLVAIPVSVHAGVFNSIVSFWKQAEAEEIFVIKNTAAHESAVLSAAIHSDPQAAIGGGDVLADDGSLISTGIAGPDDMEKSLTSDEISVYVVQPGDTASQIAEMFGVSANTIYWANDIKNGVIQPGDTLVILPINGVRHVVKEGETVSTIAKKYQGDVEEILSYNQLASADDISVGDTVVVPNGEVKSAPKTASAAKPTSVSGVVSSSGSFSHPLPGARRTQGIHGHNGVDLGAPNGTAIRAAAAGEVIVSKSSGWNGGYGNYVVIKHGNGTQTLYAHNSSNAVGVGAYVSAGEVIGYIGNTGKSTGSHLHFEVRGASNPF
jgi:LysM repeat protein